MSLEKDDNAYLWDMLTAARAVETFVKDRTHRRLSGRSDAPQRGGAASRDHWRGCAASLSRIPTAHPEIPWRPMQAQRHVLAHDYGEIRRKSASGITCWRFALVRNPLGRSRRFVRSEQLQRSVAIGTQGTMSEAELHVLQGRMHQGKLNKAAPRCPVFASSNRLYARSVSRSDP